MDPGEDRHLDRERVFAMLHRGEMAIGEAVRHMRRRWAGLRQRDLARICGVSVNTLSAIERDDPGVKIDTLNRVLKAFGAEVGVRPRPQSW